MRLIVQEIRPDADCDFKKPGKDPGQNQFSHVPYVAKVFDTATIIIRGFNLY
jgi:hypothetical protein